MISTVQKYRLGKTRMQFPCGGPCVQYYDLSRGLEERASFGIFLVIGSL
jgi:hypothetical protein